MTRESRMKWSFLTQEKHAFERESMFLDKSAFINFIEYNDQNFWENVLKENDSYKHSL